MLDWLTDLRFRQIIVSFQEQEHQVQADFGASLINCMRTIFKSYNFQNLKSHDG